MANGILRTRLDPTLEAKGTAILNAIGLTPGEAFRLMMVRVCAEGRLPFDPLVPSAETLQAIEDAREGRVTKVRDLKALKAALNAGD